MIVIPRSPVSPDRPPLDPSAPDARHQLAQELAKSQYAAARPSWLDLVTQQLQKWLNSLFNGVGTGLPGGAALILLVIVIVVVLAIIVVFLIFGVPRFNRRSTITGALFGDEDDRTADALRRAAEQAAAGGDYRTAIEEGFRAIARGLAERVAVTTFPGTTAHTFAMQASGVFPAFSAELSRAADTFDRVRYLGSAATESDWLAVHALEAGLRQARPELEPA